MNITAVIAEYNPFTKGHLKHLEAAKSQTQADAVIAVMSGSFTQRGDAAVADKYQRAEVAVRLGADAVIELPFLYAVSPADNFAYGALKTLSAIPDIVTLSFGSECGDANLIVKAADLLSDEPEELSLSVKAFLQEGDPYPKARARALNAYAVNHTEFADLAGILDAPNNLLGIAYVTQMRRQGLNYHIHTVKRLGTGFNSNDITGEYPSASAVRKALVDGKLEEAKNALPAFSYNLLVSQNAKADSLGDMMLFKLKSIDGNLLATYYDVSEGLHNRLKIAAAESSSFEEFLTRAKTKRYTMARIKRICLYALFDITQAHYDELASLPPYVRVLAVNKLRKDLLSALSRAQNVMLRHGDVQKIDKRLRYSAKLDFTAQGTLSILLRNTDYKKSLSLV